MFLLGQSRCEVATLALRSVADRGDEQMGHRLASEPDLREMFGARRHEARADGSLGGDAQRCGLGGVQRRWAAEGDGLGALQRVIEHDRGLALKRGCACIGDGVPERVEILDGRGPFRKTHDPVQHAQFAVALVA